MGEVVLWFFAIVGVLFMIPVFLTIAIAMVGLLMPSCALMFAALRHVLSPARLSSEQQRGGARSKPRHHISLRAVSLGRGGNPVGSPK